MTAAVCAYSGSLTLCAAPKLTPHSNRSSMSPLSLQQQPWSRPTMLLEGLQGSCIRGRRLTFATHTCHDELRHPSQLFISLSLFVTALSFPYSAVCSPQRNVWQ